MEVYLIECLINNKYYIGSTSQTKEDRWSRQGWSHLNYAYKKLDSRDLYKDIRLYGDRNFKLQTLEIVTDKSNLINREDFWIKRYFEKYGSSRMYNMYPGAKISGNGKQLCTPEAISKSINTKINKYGTSFYVNEEGIAKRTKTHITNKTSIYSDESRHKKSSEITYNNCIFYGVTEFCNYLNNNGYDLSWNQVRRLALDNYFSKSNKIKYPELVNSVLCRRKNER